MTLGPGQTVTKKGNKIVLSKLTIEDIEDYENLEDNDLILIETGGVP